MTFEIRRLSSALGAEVLGVDLSQDLDEAIFAEIEAAWREHLVLLFRGQKLDHARHVAFSRRFGTLDDHGSIPNFRDEDFPEILLVENRLMNGRPQPVGRQWHSDLSSTRRPARASLLRCEVLPPVGGDTMFANMYLAYETLSPAMQEIVGRLKGIHDMMAPKHNRGRAPDDLAEARRRNPPVAHPMVKVHPETGKKALYVNEMNTNGIVGLTEDEAKALLEFLFRHSVRPEFTYRHRWQQHDLICWDNRCTMHLALDDYDIRVPRRMYRTTLLGEDAGELAETASA